MATIFRIGGTDKRRELIAAHKREDVSFEIQMVSGQSVEYFSKSTGFVLLNKKKKTYLDLSYMQKAVSCAMLSMGVPLELREFYYTLRSHPELAGPWGAMEPKGIYASVLRAINDLEIICDVGREKFTIGHLSKGFIFDAHSYSYANKVKRIAFSEYLARHLNEEPWEIETTQNIIIVEKNSAASRLVDLGFSELTNSMIVTVGGNFNRAVWELTKGMKDKKNLLFICDGDAFGDDMLRTIAVGTMNSRHLDYKFPPNKNPNIHLVGLWPSVGERIGLPNDVEQKRPMNNPHTKKRVEFLKRYDLVDPRDIATWERNQTFELEALSTAYLSTTTRKPIGMAIMLIEYMRIKNIPIKVPIPDDIKEQFDQAAHDELKSEIEEGLEIGSPKERLLEMVAEYIDGLTSEAATKIYNERVGALEKCLEEVTEKEIIFHINQQFIQDPNRSSYDLRAIAHKLKTPCEINMDWDSEGFVGEIRDNLVEYTEQLSRDEGWEYKIEFTPIHNETHLDDVYDIALNKLGAKPEDCAVIREALEWRFGTDA